MLRAVGGVRACWAGARSPQSLPFEREAEAAEDEQEGLVRVRVLRLEEFEVRTDISRGEAGTLLPAMKQTLLTRRLDFQHSSKDSWRSVSGPMVEVCVANRMSLGFRVSGKCNR